MSGRVCEAVTSNPEPCHPWSHARRMDDPAAVKPEGWDDRRIVSDPSVTKPDGWLDHEVPDIPDPNAVKPNDWDEAKEGVWLPPPIL